MVLFRKRYNLLCFDREVLESIEILINKLNKFTNHL